MIAWGSAFWVTSPPTEKQPVERDLRWGVYVVFKAENDYAASCFKQYGLPTDHRALCGDPSRFELGIGFPS
jgi:hypothetical protein